MRNPKILVTGGPVEVNLDAVKIITNRFKGGRMLALSSKLAHLGADVTYLCSKDRVEGAYELSTLQGSIEPQYSICQHSGFDDYMEKVLRFAPEFDCVVLGAAVANLIPDEEWKRVMLRGGKFPSHIYEEGDPIPVLFRIAPRIINRIKEVAPKTKLVGFKLLSDVAPEVLIDAARTVISESKANLVIANDAKCLNAPYGVTPEGGSFAIPNAIDGIADVVYNLACDEFYSSNYSYGINDDKGSKQSREFFDILCNKFKSDFVRQKNGMLFGCVAVRSNREGRFLISSRGKKLLDERTTVSVSGESILLWGGDKASLNAPLIDNIFNDNPDVEGVVHYHFGGIRSHLPNLYDWAPPGTVRDSCRDVSSDFSIEGHGTYRLFTKKEIEMFRGEVGGC
jgi:hypothetical protein